MRSKNKWGIRVVAPMVAISAMALSGTQAAVAAEPVTADTAREAVQAVSDVAPDVLAASTGTSGLDVSTREASVSLEAAPEVSLALPFADVAEPTLDGATGLTVLDNKNGSSSVPVNREDGSTQILTVIDSETAPTRYSYVLDVPGDATVQDIGGVITITSSQGDFLGAVAPAWAKDALGNPVSTHFELDGQTLTQVVEHAQGAQYPVVADPWLGQALFSSVGVSSENGQPRYMLYRSGFGSAVSTGLAQGGGAAGIAAGQQIMLNAGWSEATTKNSGLKSKASLKQQYDCHVFYAFAKPDSWNLEKFRANNSGWGSNPLSHLCNW